MSWIDDAMAKNLLPPAFPLPSRFANAVYGDLPTGDLRQCVLDYVTNFYDVGEKGIGCLFVGRARLWKTYAACVIGRTLNAKLRLDGAFVQCAVEVARMERQRFAPETEERINRLSSMSFVIMDDFAQVPERGFGAQVLVSIAESRFAANRPTIWTGNIGGVGSSSGDRDIVQALANLYGAGFARRVWDGTEGYRVRVA